jgi:hypothetical protein
MTSEHHHSEHEEAHSGPDTVPAITGLIVGAILLFALLSSIVVITTKHYEATEKPAAAAQ